MFSLLLCHGWDHAGESSDQNVNETFGRGGGGVALKDGGDGGVNA